MDKLKDPEFCLDVLGEPESSEYVEKLFEESAEFLVGNEVEVAVH
jgi:hypothetical protein